MTRPPLLRGPVLWPRGPESAVALADAVVGPGLRGPHPPRQGEDDPVDGLVLPAFGDWHFHWVQAGIAGAAADGREPLLDWLRDRAWPEEERVAAASDGAARADRVLRALASAGTAAGAAYAAPRAPTAEAFLAEAHEGFVCGPAVMTTGGPSALLRTPSEALADLGRLHRRFGRRLVVAPRFALSCDAGTLAALGRFADEHRLLVQTHLSENPDEVEAVRRAFPDAADPLDVYGRAGLVTSRTLLGHSIHVSDDELRRIADANACVVHCPTSNRALGSGRMPLERLRRAGVRWVLGSDVGAGPDFCLLDAMAESLAQQEPHTPLRASEVFHRATLGRTAVAAGTTEVDVPIGDRPGAIVVAPPDGIDLSKPDADAWLEALLAHWRRHRRLEVRRLVVWHGSQPSGHLPAAP